jgi:two-component system chemotaxis sensor kinase CheA
MDDLLREFLTETSDSLDAVGVELVRFEQEPNNAQILQHIFRLVHTIKRTCGFLSLPRLEALAHAAESVMGKFRDGMPVSGEAVTLILASIDRLKEILATLEATEEEPSGNDADRIRVFSHEGRAMGLLVDEILDIVTDRLCVDAASETPGLLGSAIIDGKATEIIDVEHFLPLAFEDWFRRKELSRRVAAPELLLVDDSPFFRSMLPPLLHSAGYRVTAVGSSTSKIAQARAGRRHRHWRYAPPGGVRCMEYGR